MDQTTAQAAPAPQPQMKVVRIISKGKRGMQVIARKGEGALQTLHIRKQVGSGWSYCKRLDSEGNPVLAQIVVPQEP